MVSKAMTDDANSPAVPEEFAPKRVSSIRNLNLSHARSGSDSNSSSFEVASQPSAEQVSGVLDSIASLNMRNRVQTGALGLERLDSGHIPTQSTGSELDTLEEES